MAVCGDILDNIGFNLFFFFELAAFFVHDKQNKVPNSKHDESHVE
jgi:hypothetical protein